MAKLIVVLLLIVLVIAVVRLQGDVYKRFKDNASEVMGKIDKKETRIDHHHSQRKEEHVLIYSYSVNGTEYHGEERVEYTDLWMDAREGMELRVYVDKNNPAKSYPAALIDRRLKISGAMQ